MGQISDDEIINAIKRVGLDLYDKKIVKKYSLGMKQKIVIAQAIMEKPDFCYWMSRQMLWMKVE